MFKIDPNPTFKHKVTIPTPSNGAFVNQELEVTYTALTDDVTAEFNFNTTQGERDFLRAAIADLSDVQGPDGKEITDTDEKIDTVIALPYARQPLIVGYAAGIVRGRVGN
jgi:hypothetical protein